MLCEEYDLKALRGAGDGDSNNLVARVDIEDNEKQSM